MTSPVWRPVRGIDFRKLHDEYHTLNRTIHRGETNVEPMDDVRMETMRKQRLKLKDEIYGMLKG